MEQEAVFAVLRTMVAKKVPPLEVLENSSGRYEVGSTKPVTVAGRKREGVSFASIITQQDYVGLYFMPIYTHREAFTLSDALDDRLNGKSCFHITEVDDALRADLQELIDTGLSIYRDEDWV